MAEKIYPDLSDIFARRDEGRSARAKMSMDEKFKVMDKLRATADEFKELRRWRGEENTSSKRG